MAQCGDRERDAKHGNKHIDRVHADRGICLIACPNPMSAPNDSDKARTQEPTG
jgi:hypothetical protein